MSILFMLIDHVHIKTLFVLAKMKGFTVTSLFTHGVLIISLNNICRQLLEPYLYKMENFIPYFEVGGVVMKSKHIFLALLWFVMLQ